MLIDQCFTNNETKCLNGGICNTNDCDYNCTCQKGYTGKNCESRKNLCEPNKCLNGAVCIEDSDDYQCKCPCKYFTGMNNLIRLEFRIENLNINR